MTQFEMFPVNHLHFAVDHACELVKLEIADMVSSARRSVGQLTRLDYLHLRADLDWAFSVASGVVKERVIEEMRRNGWDSSLV